MTFSELCQVFAAYTGAVDQAEPAQLALWFNEAQLDLAYELGPVSTQEIEAAPGDCIRPGSDWLCLTGCDLDCIQLADGRLQFVNGGRGTLCYRALPPAFTGTDGDQTSPLPPPVHYLLALFAAARYWDMESEGDGEESALASKWLSYYYQGKSIARSRLPGAAAAASRWTVA